MHYEESLKRVLLIIAVLNLAYFGVEFTIAEIIGSVSLLTDSIHFLEDVSMDFPNIIALGWTLPRGKIVVKIQAGILLIFGLATLSMVWQKFFFLYRRKPVRYPSPKAMP